jgi:hypothetical protein
VIHSALGGVSPDPSLAGEGVLSLLYVALQQLTATSPLFCPPDFGRFSSLAQASRGVLTDRLSRNRPHSSLTALGPPDGEASLTRPVGEFGGGLKFHRIIPSTYPHFLHLVYLQYCGHRSVFRPSRCYPVGSSKHAFASDWIACATLHTHSGNRPATGGAISLERRLGRTMLLIGHKSALASRTCLTGMDSTGHRKNLTKRTVASVFLVGVRVNLKRGPDAISMTSIPALTREGSLGLIVWFTACHVSCGGDLSASALVHL